MIKVNIIAVSSVKEKYFKEAANEYIKSLGGYCNLSVTEIEPVKLSEKPSEKEINAALEKEGEQILKRLSAETDVFVLCIEGKELSSEELAREVKADTDSGRPITFVIGGSYGLSQSVKQAGKRLSFSKMTFPHRLFRIMLLEQLYRAFKINLGGSYHK